MRMARQGAGVYLLVIFMRPQSSPCIVRAKGGIGNDMRGFELGSWGMCLRFVHPRPVARPLFQKRREEAGC
jgi:hypothetical protein